VNHEFGFPYEELSQLRRHGLPLIEDAAHSFASDNREGTVSRVGNFTVYSLSKFFPIQVGGLLVFEDGCDIREPVSPATKEYIQKVIGHHLGSLDATCRKRRENYTYLASRFASLGGTPRFPLSERSVPGVFMFRADATMDLPALKTFLWQHGIECSVFYGEQAFYLPVNERLQTGDLDFFYEAVRSFSASATIQNHDHSPISNH
jgi:dTDP-4-amino-4,6-dideoxygalactose transaminase